MAAAASSAEAYGAWVYLAVFALMALTFVGVPAVGAAVVGWAAVLASQGKLNIWWVLIVAALGAEVGGIGGYHIGERWGRQLLEQPPQGPPVAPWRRFPRGQRGITLTCAVRLPRAA
jgi:membrane protein DedA with SNARE-associated domain